MREVNISTIIRAVLTGLLIIGAAAWLLVVFGKLDNAPVKDKAGNITYDEFQRSKDILLVVVPLLTTALGYWFGSAGREQAEDKAKDAQEQARDAQQKIADAEVQTKKAKEQLAGVLDSTTEKDLLNRAKEKYPKAFE